jgi:hypothetical protein
MTRLNKIQKGCEEGTGCKGLEGIKKANNETVEYKMLG